MTVDLPPGWTTGSGGELFSIITSGSRGWANYYAAAGARFIRVQNVRRGHVQLDLSDVQHVQPPAGAEGQRTRLRSGDLVITITADLGRVGLVPADIGEAYVNQHVALARPKDSSMSSYLAWFLTSADAQEQLGLLDRGATRAGLGLKDLAGLRIPVPPLAEQRRIVARIEALFARTRQARADLLRIAPLSERYRARAVAAPFESNAAAAWPRRALNEILTEGRIGLVRSKEEQATEGGVPYIRMQHYDQYGRWNADKLTFVSVSPAEITAYELLTDDLLFNTRNSNELVGKVALWPPAKPGHVYNNNLLRLRFRQDVSPAFVRWSLVGSDAAAALHAAKSATTSVAAIYQRDLMALKIGLPSMAEQQQVAASVTVSLQAADQVEHEAVRALALLDHLERSILTRAFRGELVPQDPADKPAAVSINQPKPPVPAPRRRGRPSRAA